MQFQRLNAMGETVGRPTDRPTSRIGQNNQRQIGVLYGHNGSGKVYNYLGGSGLRAGDFVTPKVTHHKSGKEYTTLARVVSTRNALGRAAGNTADSLIGRGIVMKTIGSTDRKSLPGYKAQKEARKERGEGFTVDQWRKESNQRHDESIMRRLNPMGVPSNG